jgi:tripartite-type tricarboxylate transporter receptor subunit TctC
MVRLPRTIYGIILARTRTPRMTNHFRFARLRGVTALCLLIFAAAPVKAEDYPSRTIRIVVGFTAGGPTDIPARFIADRLSKSLGKPVVVENKPGAGAMLAANEVLSHPRDGYDLLLCTYFDAVNTQLYRSVKYKLSDILGITLIARYSYAVAVSNAIPAKTFRELIDYTKAHPDVVNYGHLGVGSTQNILAKRLEKLAGMKMTPIPYKGSAEATQEIVAGRNHVYIGPPLGVLPLYQTKQLKVLAVTGDERLASMPEVPTLKESGIPLVAYAWLGVCAGSGTPRPIVDVINREVGKIVNSQDYRALVEKSGSTAVSSTPEEFQKLIKATADDAGPTIKEFGLQLE